MGLGEVLAVGAGPLVEVGHRVEAEAVDAHVEPEAQRVEHRVVDLRVVEVEVGLVAVEAVPEVLLAHRVPGPVRRLGVDEDDPGLLVELVGVGPDVEVAVRARRGRCATAWNHGCWSLVWFMTKSMITRMPRLCASSRKSWKSSTVPTSGSMLV